MRKRVKEGDELIDHIKELAIVHFAQEALKLNLANYIFNGTYQDGIKESVSCGTSTECLKTEKVTRLLIEMTGVKIQLGTLMRNFMELGKFWSFSQIKSLLDLDVELIFAFDEETLCDYLGEEELFTHKYFSNLSRLADFDMSELNNLYELPGKLGTLIEKTGEYIPDAFDLQMFQVPFSSICMDDSTTPYINFTYCSARIQEFIENPSRGKTHKSKTVL